MDLIQTGGKGVNREPGLTFAGRERSQGQSSEVRCSGSLTSSSKLTAFDWTVSGKNKGEESQEDGGAGETAGVVRPLWTEVGSERPVTGLNVGTMTKCLPHEVV